MCKNPLFFAAADCHFSDAPPVCREGESDWMGFQKSVLSWMTEITQGLPLFLAGDIFHRPNPSFALIRLVATYFGKMDVFWIPGQHDLPYNAIENLPNSALGFLNDLIRVDSSKSRCLIKNPQAFKSRFGFTFSVAGIPWGQTEARFMGMDDVDVRVVLLHELVWKNSPPFPGASKKGKAEKILQKYSEADVIISGDNHQPFEAESKGRFLINAGSLMRRDVTQFDFQPRIIEIGMDGGDVYFDSIYWDTSSEVFSSAHIESTKRRDARIAEFVESLTGEIEFGLSFEEMLRQYLEAHDVPAPIQKIIWETFEERITT